MHEDVAFLSASLAIDPQLYCTHGFVPELMRVRRPAQKYRAAGSFFVWGVVATFFRHVEPEQDPLYWLHRVLLMVFFYILNPHVFFVRLCLSRLDRRLFFGFSQSSVD